MPIQQATLVPHLPESRQQVHLRKSGIHHGDEHTLSGVSFIMQQVALYHAYLVVSLPIVVPKLVAPLLHLFPVHLLIRLQPQVSDSPLSGDEWQLCDPVDERGVVGAYRGGIEPAGGMQDAAAHGPQTIHIALGDGQILLSHSYLLPLPALHTSGRQELLRLFYTETVVLLVGELHPIFEGIL